MPLDFGHRSALGREDFLVAASNQDAVAFLDLWPEWPARGLVIHGPEAAGKTHLAQVWRARSGALAIERDALSLDVPALLGEARDVVVEGVEQGINERGLLHLYNYLTGQGGTLLLTAASPAVRWGVGLPDLRSRLMALPSVAVGAPDDTLIEAVMIKQFADRQVRVSHGAESRGGVGCRGPGGAPPYYGPAGAAGFTHPGDKRFGTRSASSLAPILQLK
jgi:chromosomal replication initiation ATPase DnaA